MLVLKSRLGQNALERGIDPRGLCSICAEPFEGFDLHDDHVLPIGARAADEGLVLVRVDGEFWACLASEAPADGEVFLPVPCAALTHAHCNMSKGATRDINGWRHYRLPALVVAVNEYGDRVSFPPLRVLDPAPELDWTDAQQEAHDRGVEALRRRGHRSSRELKTVEELRAEQLRLDREHRRVAAEAKTDEMIEKARAKLAAMTDWREVENATVRINRKLKEAEKVQKTTPEPPCFDDDVNGYLDRCFEHDAARAELRRWETTQQLARSRFIELRQRVTYLDYQGRVIDTATGEILGTTDLPMNASDAPPDQRR